MNQRKRMPEWFWHLRIERVRRQGRWVGVRGYVSPNGNPLALEKLKFRYPIWTDNQ